MLHEWCHNDKATAGKHLSPFIIALLFASIRRLDPVKGTTTRQEALRPDGVCSPPFMPILIAPLEEARAASVLRTAAFLCVRGSEIWVFATRLSIWGPVLSLALLIPGAQRHYHIGVELRAYSAVRDPGTGHAPA